MLTFDISIVCTVYVLQCFLVAIRTLQSVMHYESRRIYLRQRVNSFLTLDPRFQMSSP